MMSTEAKGRGTVTGSASDRDGAADLCRRELVEGAGTDHGHRVLDLRPEQPQHMRDPLRASSGEAPALQPSDEHGSRAERNRLADVRAALDTAVEHHLGTVMDGVHDLLEHLDGAESVVELPAPVVRDVHRLSTEVDRPGRVLGRHDALDDEREVGPAAEAF